MSDREFLIWIYKRLNNVYGEHESLDFMHRFLSIIRSIDCDRNTPTNLK